MITREEYFKALETVKLYRKQCLDDISLSNDVVTSTDRESSFRLVASGELYRALKSNDFFSWDDNYTVDEVASLVNDYGIKELRKIRGFGGKIGLELETIVSKII